MKLEQIVYLSHATSSLDSLELTSILQTARQANQQRKITGMLLYRDRRFLQVLEGPPEDLRDLLTRLAKDGRHGELQVLLQETIQSRVLGQWSMGFCDLDGAQAKSVQGYSSFLTEGFGSVECVRYPHQALHLLHSFRNAPPEVRARVGSATPVVSTAGSAREPQLQGSR
ncbi:MAG: BLUF domain-containing protein [Bryobacteraceae bacterium]|nr:BLUF domain-containing protein [Bryobacteraceae bacterium]